MDNHGANAGENAITSDYWQGDEAKWKNSYNNSNGGIDIGNLKYDKSAKSVLRQISLPLITNNEKVIGAVTYGISINKI